MANAAGIFKVEVEGLDQLDRLEKAWAKIKKDKKIKLDVDGKPTTGAGNASMQRQKQMMGEEAKNLLTMRKSVASQFVGGIKLFATSLKRWSLWAVGAISGLAFWGLLMSREMRQQYAAGQFINESPTNIRRANYALKQSQIMQGDAAGEDVLTRISRAKLIPEEAQYRVMSGVSGWENKTPSQIFSEMMKSLANMDQGQRGTIGEQVASHFGMDIQRITPQSVAEYEQAYKTAPMPSDAAIKAGSDLNQWWERFKESMETNGIKILAKFGPVLQTVVNYLDRAAGTLTKYLLSPEFSNDMRSLGDMLKYFAVKLAGVLSVLGVKNFAPKEWRNAVAAMDAADDIGKYMKEQPDPGTISEMTKRARYGADPESAAKRAVELLNKLEDRQTAVRQANRVVKESGGKFEFYIKSDSEISYRMVQAAGSTGNTPLTTSAR